MNKKAKENLMDKIVALAKRRGFNILAILFERSETTKWPSAKALAAAD